MNLPHLLASLGALYDVQLSEKTYKGIIIALAVPPAVAAQVAVPGELEPEGMHVTLAYLGNVDDHADALPFLRLARTLSDLAQSSPPLTAHFGGPGRFLGVDDGNDACYLSVDSVGLPELRQACVEAARAAGVPEDTTHGFTPHVTVAYVPPGAPHPRETPEQEPFTFTSLGLWLGGHRVTFPFYGGVRGALRAIVDKNFGRGAFAKADREPGDPRRAAQAMLATLGGDLRRVDREDHALQTVSERLRQHHSDTFEGLVQAIPAPRGSELEEAALYHAGEAAGARRAGA